METKECIDCGAPTFKAEKYCSSCKKPNRTLKKRSDGEIGDRPPCRVCGRATRALKNALALEQNPRNATHLCLEHYYDQCGYNFPKLEDKLKELDEEEKKMIARHPKKTSEISRDFSGRREMAKIVAQHLYESYYFPSGR